jgi:2-dehydropantoate 2-reductase
MKTRIGVLGIGGVGGYFGGQLAEVYADSEWVEIIFIARGITQKNIVANGLKIISDEGEKIVFPTIVSNQPEEIGILDYLICSTKTYDIEASFQTIKDCISGETIILPLYNGVDAPDRIVTIFPNNPIVKGCVFIVSKIIAPGIIQKTGVYHHLFFGSKTVEVSKLKALEAIFEKAHFKSQLVTNIEETVWEKFVFISPLASVTSYLNQNIGQILNHKESRSLFNDLLQEILQLAAAKEIHLPQDIMELTIIKLEKSPHEATSSMHRDYIAGNRTEVASLTEYVVNEGMKFNIRMPTYGMILEDLLKK